MTIAMSTTALVEDRCHALGQRLQALVGVLETGSLDALLAGVRILASQVQPPISFIEGCVQRTLLRDFVQRASSALGDLDPLNRGDLVEGLADFRNWAGSLKAEHSLIGVAHGNPSANLRHVVTIILEEATRPVRPGVAPFTLACVARRLQRNASYISTTFHRAFGLTFESCVARARVAKAVRLLRAGTKPEAVAFLVGYRSRSQFYKTFKRLTDRTPAYFRSH